MQTLPEQKQRDKTETGESQLIGLSPENFEKLKAELASYTPNEEIIKASIAGVNMFDVSGKKFTIRERALEILAKVLANSPIIAFDFRRAYLSGTNVDDLDDEDDSLTCSLLKKVFDHAQPRLKFLYLDFMSISNTSAFKELLPILGTLPAINSLILDNSPLVDKDPLSSNSMRYSMVEATLEKNASKMEKPLSSLLLKDNVTSLEIRSLSVKILTLMQFVEHSRHLKSLIAHDVLRSGPSVNQIKDFMQKLNNNYSLTSLNISLRFAYPDTVAPLLSARQNDIGKILKRNMAYELTIYFISAVVAGVLPFPEDLIKTIMLPYLNFNGKEQPIISNHEAVQIGDSNTYYHQSHGLFFREQINEAKHRQFTYEPHRSATAIIEDLTHNVLQEKPDIPKLKEAIALVVASLEAKSKVWSKLNKSHKELIKPLLTTAFQTLGCVIHEDPWRPLVYLVPLAKNTPQDTLDILKITAEALKKLGYSSASLEKSLPKAPQGCIAVSYKDFNKLEKIFNFDQFSPSVSQSSHSSRPD